MNPVEKKYAKAAQKMIIFESVLAVSEMQQSKMEVLQMKGDTKLLMVLLLMLTIAMEVDVKYTNK